MKKRAIFVIFLLLIVGLSGCIKDSKDDYVVRVYNLDEAFSIFPVIKVIAKKSEFNAEPNLQDELNLITKDLNNTFNVILGTGETSLLKQVNDNAGIKPVEVTDEVIYVINQAKLVSAMTVVDDHALYDISIKPVWDKWDFPNKYYSSLRENYETIPTVEEINPLLPLVDYRNIEVDEEAKTIFLNKPGMEIDLGSILKGYACDKIKQYLLSKGFINAVIDVGGNVMTMGSNLRDGEFGPWLLGIQTPYVTMFSDNYAKTSYIGTFSKNDITVVTSGVYERYIMTEKDGIKYHHILDPRNGFPINNGLISVTIITDKSTLADAFSTAVFSLGLEDGLKLVEETDYIEAVFITDEKEIYVSSGFDGVLDFNENISDLGYTYKGVINGTNN